MPLASLRSYPTSRPHHEAAAPVAVGETLDMGCARKRVDRGEVLYPAGRRFESLFTICSGFFKSCVVLEDGRGQVTGFHMAGDMLGLDGVGCGTHASDMIALEPGEVLVIPASRLDEPGVQRQLGQAMARELARHRDMMLLLGSMTAAQRLAAFLLDLSQRLAARGASPAEFRLRMTRAEIGGYLGLTLETVSRVFSHFHAGGLVEVRQREVRILDVAGLKAVRTDEAHQGACRARP